MPTKTVLEQPMGYIKFDGWEFLSYKGKAKGSLSIEIREQGTTMTTVNLDVNKHDPITRFYSELSSRRMSPRPDIRYKLDKWMSDQVASC